MRVVRDVQRGKERANASRSHQRSLPARLTRDVRARSPALSPSPPPPPPPPHTHTQTPPPPTPPPPTRVCGVCQVANHSGRVDGLGAALGGRGQHGGSVAERTSRGPRAGTAQAPAHQAAAVSAPHHRPSPALAITAVARPHLIRILSSQQQSPWSCVRPHLWWRRPPPTGPAPGTAGMPRWQQPAAGKAGMED